MVGIPELVPSQLLVVGTEEGGNHRRGRHRRCHQCSCLVEGLCRQEHTPSPGWKTFLMRRFGDQSSLAWSSETNQKVGKEEEEEGGEKIGEKKKERDEEETE